VANRSSTIAYHQYEVNSVCIDTEIVEETNHCLHNHLFTFEHGTLHRESLSSIRRTAGLTYIVGSACLDDEIFTELRRRQINFSYTNFAHWKQYLGQFRIEEAIVLEKDAQRFQSLNPSPRQLPRLYIPSQSHESIKQYSQVTSYDQGLNISCYQSLPVIPQTE